MKLTPKEREYLDFIKAYQASHGGLGPSYLDIIDALETTQSTAQDYMERLKDKGAVKWPKRLLRKITVLK